ncbi:MAG: TraB/GumN family protein [Runella sp.]
MKIKYLVLFLLSFHLIKAQENSLLWEISGNGLSQPSYLYGTIHLICPNDYFLTDSTRWAVERSEQIYLELDMDDPTLLLKIPQMMMLQNGLKIKDLLSPNDYQILDDYFQRKGMNINMMESTKPFALMSLMYMTLLNCPPQSYEANFMQMATQAKKEILGLETVEFQMGVFDSIPYAKQAAMLVEMARESQKSVNEFELMVQAYKNQDLAQLYKMLQESPSNFEGYEDVLLARRNQAWIPVMYKAMQSKPTFFAVGAGHLEGQKGVIALLRKEGFRVRAMR